MKSISHNWIVLLVLLLIMQTGATFNDSRLVYQDNHFLMEGLFQLQATDLNNDGISDYVVAGKNYTGRELLLAWFTLGPDYKPVVQWRSPNLFEDRSVIWAATGKFSGGQNQILAVTNTQYYLYQWVNGQIELVRKGTHNIQQPLNVVGGDVDGDGVPELVVAKVGRVTAQQYDDLLQVWQLKENGFQLLAETERTVGNIRSLAVGDLNDDGRAEVVMEEGTSNRPGDLHVFALNDKNQLVEQTHLKRPVRGVIYGMKISSQPGASRLVTATDTGRLNVYAWDPDRNGLRPVEKEYSAAVSSMSLSTIAAAPKLPSCY